MLYLAYGSNMNIEQMLRRCPGARVLRAVTLQDWRLEFRGVATIVPHAGARVPCALWEITEACEAALDRYEGYPRLYRKETVELPDGSVAMVYMMNGGVIAPPTDVYYETILKGYTEFALNVRYLNEAVRRAERRVGLR